MLLGLVSHDHRAQVLVEARECVANLVGGGGDGGFVCWSGRSDEVLHGSGGCGGDIPGYFEEPALPSEVEERGRDAECDASHASDRIAYPRCML